MTSDINRRFDRSQNWSESCHFFAGNQWIRYSQNIHRFETIPITDSNRAIERPVTNHFLRWIIVNVSGFSNKPNITCDPASDDQRDKTSAKVGDVILDYLWAEHDKSDQYYEAALWGALCGPVFRKSAKLPMGKYYKDAPMYCVKPKIVPPFQMIFDGVPSRFKDIGVIMETYVMRVKDVKEIFGQQKDGYYPSEVAKVEPEKINSLPISVFEGLKNIIAGETTVPFSESVGGDYIDSCIVKEVYVEPSEKHPEGLMIIVAGNCTVYAGPSPYYYNDGKIWHPYTFWNYFKMPGSVWGLGIGQQLTKLQRRINSIDALMVYNRKTMAVPITWNPKGSEVPAGIFVGMPGQVVDYAESPNGRRPERDPGVPLPPQIMQEREMILADGDKIALAADIRGGQNPAGVNTLGQLQILTEQAEISRSKQTESWEEFIESSEYLDLLNFKSCYEVPDPKVNLKLKNMSKDLTNFDWKTFTGNDIRENCTVRVERGSTVNRSRLLQQDTIMKLATAQLLPEIMAGPYERKKFLEKFGLSELFSDVNVDEKYAEKCIELMQGENPAYPPVIDGVHNPDAQLPVLLRFMKDPKYLELPDKNKMLFNRRREELTALLAKAIQGQPQLGNPSMGPMPAAPRQPAPQPAGAASAL